MKRYDLDPGDRIILREALRDRAAKHREHAKALRAHEGAGGNGMISRENAARLAEEHELMAKNCDRLLELHESATFVVEAEDDVVFPEHE